MIYPLKERKKGKKKRKEGERICNEKARDQACEAFRLLASFTIQRHKCDPIRNLFSRGSRSRSKVLHEERWSVAIARIPSLFLGLDTVEKVVEACAWSDIGSAIVEADLGFPRSRKSVEWLRSRTKEIMWRSSRCQVLVASRRSHDIPHPGTPTSTWH